MDIKKLIKDIEAAKKSLLVIRKTIDKEKSRVEKLEKKNQVAWNALEAQNVVKKGESEAEADKRLDALRDKQDNFVGCEELLLGVGDPSDFGDESLLGAISSAQSALGDMISFRLKKKPYGLVVRYEEMLKEHDELIAKAAKKTAKKAAKKVSKRARRGR
jgi:fatty acid-binding protein DegV